MNCDLHQQCHFHYQCGSPLLLHLYPSANTYHPRFCPVHLRCMFFFKLVTTLEISCSKIAGSTGTLDQWLFFQWVLASYPSHIHSAKMFHNFSLNGLLTDMLVHQEVLILKFNLLESRPYL